MGERIETVVIGGGPSGLAVSYLLTTAKRPHVVLEAGRIGESWRSRRWDSLRLSGANWHLGLPGRDYQGDDPYGFMTHHEVVEFLDGYANSFNPPVREGIPATAVKAGTNDWRFVIETLAGSFEANHVVLATGSQRVPKIPACSVALPAGVRQLAAVAYRNPEVLPPGAILVVGSGQSGTEIADELQQHGRTVYLSVGRCWWAPPWYRGRDMWWWFAETGGWNNPARQGALRASPQATGQGGGRTLNLHLLARRGVTLLGHLDGTADGFVRFKPDLSEHVEAADRAAAHGLRIIDAHVAATGLDAPPDEQINDPALWSHVSMSSPLTLDIGAAGISTVIWATGYHSDFHWVHLPAFDDNGSLIHENGIAAYEGLYFPRGGTLPGVKQNAIDISAAIIARTA